METLSEQAFKILIVNEDKQHHLAWLSYHSHEGIEFRSIPLEYPYANALNPNFILTDIIREYRESHMSVTPRTLLFGSEHRNVIDKIKELYKSIISITDLCVFSFSPLQKQDAENIVILREYVAMLMNRLKKQGG